MFFQLMAKPAGSVCNLDCQYCYYLDKPHLSQRHMDFALLERYIQNYIASISQSEVTFLWQGGEPTLAGLAFYQQAVEFQQKYAKGKIIHNALQTNGILLDDAWCEFLQKNHFLVGLSIDGTPKLHDSYRLTKSGKGSAKQVLHALNLLQHYQIPFNTLTVVHHHNVQHGKAIYHYLKSLNVSYMQFIPLMGEHSQRASPRDYGQMMIDIFDEWYAADIGKISVQFIEQWMMAFLGLQPSLCIFRKTCGDQLVIEQNGDIFSCDHYVYPEYKLGNILDTPLIDLIQNPKQQRFGLIKAQLSTKCQQCQFRFACNGGCPKHRTVQGFGEPHNQLCEAYFMALSYMQPYLKELAKYFR
ncbi:anaerobic sulfatase maturase [Pasteurellaceae bacterium Macca]|nr:anaerobic sulfatase maturase [Pasteurellaceae bacterium Macca]